MYLSFSFQYAYRKFVPQPYYSKMLYFNYLNGCKPEVQPKIWNTVVTCWKSWIVKKQKKCVLYCRCSISWCRLSSALSKSDIYEWCTAGQSEFSSRWRRPAGVARGCRWKGHVAFVSPSLSPHAPVPLLNLHHFSHRPPHMNYFHLSILKRTPEFFHTEEAVH